MPVFSRFLRYFVAVGRSGSIRRASEELNVSASAIDRQILAAEQELGVALFERLPTGLRLTSAGEMMMASASGWQKGLGDLRARIEDMRGLRRGHVTVAVIDALARGTVPALIRRVQADYPGISIDLRVLDNRDVADAIRSGAVDFGILLDPRFSRDLTVCAHADVMLGFVTLPGHPLTEAPRRRFSASAGHRLIVPAPPLALAEQLAVLQGVTGVAIDPVVTVDNVQMIKSLVQEGAGVGILTSLDVHDEVAAGDLAFTLIGDAIARPMTLALCVGSPRQLSAAAQLLLESFGTIFAGFGGRLPASPAAQAALEPTA
ncbi:LysR family transcriptional regulator [Sphingomonas sp. AP4-R1]|uniref:LysR family transcriptional regulator n=1 Tax=Sphingomonas sp. AP4-R1 TaxID=2735134 RepID=UPI0014937813|nr:LysR family transcriptional regulator [Sphingomonas sp. AP4-R1]QJU56814.1 LysR family transcriptional regulator [Sphingomonas sp. AP4-R1]